MVLTCVLACDMQGGIAKEGVIPWHIPDDLRVFRSMTLENVVIMGRKTYDSLPAKNRPLPNRVNIVVTNSAVEDETVVTRFMNLEQVKQYIVNNSELELWLIGGAALLAELERADLVDAYLLTIIHKSFECDTKIDLDRIRFYKSRLVFDTYDRSHNELMYHIEYRSMRNSFKMDTLEKIRMITA